MADRLSPRVLAPAGHAAGPSGDVAAVVRPVPAGWRHVALLYRDDAEYAELVADFVRAGIAGGEPVIVAVPPERAELLADQLAGSWASVRYTDMSVVGRNPGRIIPHLRGFADEHRGLPVRWVGESAWPGRSAAELCEAVWHEALVNLAFSDLPMTSLCLYDSAGLDPLVVEAAERTHPAVISGGAERQCADPAACRLIPAGWDQPLPPPSAGAHELRYTADLTVVRQLVDRQAIAAGLTADRAADLVLAVSELAANTLRHASGQGTLAVWQLGNEIICEITDTGRIADPLAGRIRRPPDGSGHGLWLVHQVCDLVQLRTGPDGTQVRLHMRVAA
jgi:anti-sigma regulatory factor (Ser/Thr protein kinase)